MADVISMHTVMSVVSQTEAIEAPCRYASLHGCNPLPLTRLVCLCRKSTKELKSLIDYEACLLAVRREVFQFV